MSVRAFRPFIVLILTVPFLLGASARKDWKETSSLDTEGAYELFLQEHPDGRYTDRANEKLEQKREARLDVEDWQDAESQNTFASYRSYSEAHPNGANIAEATARLKKLASFFRPSSVIFSESDDDSSITYGFSMSYRIGDKRRTIEGAIGEGESVRVVDDGITSVLYENRSFWTSIDQDAMSNQMAIMNPNKELRTLELRYDSTGVLLNIDTAK